MALTDEHRDLLARLGLPTSLSDLSGDEVAHIDDAVSDEMQMRGLNDAGDGLNAYGELCVDILAYLGENY